MKEDKNILFLTGKKGFEKFCSEAREFRLLIEEGISAILNWLPRDGVFLDAIVVDKAIFFDENGEEIPQEKEKEEEFLSGAQSCFVPVIYYDPDANDDSAARTSREVKRRLREALA